MKKLNSIKFYGMGLPMFAFFAVIIVIAAYFDLVPN